jgi:hypothetical protein
MLCRSSTLVSRQKYAFYDEIFSVDAAERQELMLLRMGDVITNGIGNLAESFGGYDENELPTPIENGFLHHPSLYKDEKHQATASSLCHNLVNFAFHLSK